MDNSLPTLNKQSQASDFFEIITKPEVGGLSRVSRTPNGEKCVL